MEAALAFASSGLEAIAWQRATVGAEEKIYRDGRLVSVKVKPSDAMLRLLLQGANPGKYGRTGQLPKGAALKRLKKEAEREIRAKLRDRFTATREETEARVMQVLGKVRRQLGDRAPDQAGAALDDGKGGRGAPPPRLAGTVDMAAQPAEARHRQAGRDIP